MDLPPPFADPLPPPFVNVRTLAGYPVRGNLWTGCSNWQHMAQGVHEGKFPIAWLKSLTWAELQSLHSDDHENRVQWKYVPGR